MIIKRISRLFEVQADTLHGGSEDLLQIKNSKFKILWDEVSLDDNSKAFEIIFHEYYKSLCSFSMRFLKSKEQAKDSVSEVFFKLWKNRKAITISTSLRAYLFIAVRNQCLNSLNKPTTDCFSRNS